MICLKMAAATPAQGLPYKKCNYASPTPSLWRALTTETQSSLLLASLQTSLSDITNSNANEGQADNVSVNSKWLLGNKWQ